MEIEINQTEENVLRRIHFVRGLKIMLDRDLAILFQVETKQLKRQVRRNIERFPSDFLFEHTQEKWDNLSCQFGTSSIETDSSAWGGTRYLPMAFTEQGVAMLSKLTQKEWEFLRSKSATTNLEMRRNPPYAFTEHGVLLLSSVLNNQKAIQVNIQLVRIYTKMRDLLLNQGNIVEQIEKLANRIDHQDEKIDGVVRYLQRFVKDQKSDRLKVGYKN